MSEFSKEETEKLEKIFSDLKLIFKREEIGLSEIDDLEEELESEEVKNYLKDLRSKSKPETALREELMAGNSLLSKFFFGRTSPEVGTSEGFIDYKIEDDLPMLLELKPTFTPNRDSKGNLQSLKQKELDWRDYKDQIEKYRTENEFLVLTNLKTWFFFSRRSPEPVHEESISFEDFYEDFRREVNLRNYLERLENKSIKGGLDELFFESLERWVSSLESVEFKEDIDRDKIELIVKMINKFIFIQTLDDHSVIDFQWIRNNWQEKVRDWQNLGEKKVLEEFFEKVDNWFNAYYDTELFRGNILDYISKNEENLETFYSKLEKVLGLEHWQKATSERGIINYNFRKIDEDVFGKAYETFLAEVRKEQGIYYTPKYITQHIVENTVGKKFDEKIDEFRESIESKEFDKAEKVLEKFTTLRVLDPACGSGSFLIKALRLIWEKYQTVIDLIKKKKSESQNFEESLKMTEEEKEISEGTSRLEEILNFSDERDLISKIILRHIHGNDLDKRALDVAKLNIWLEAIKLVPKRFRYDDIPSGEGYVLPDLEMNLGHGDSLVGLPEDSIIEYFEKNHQEDLEELTKFRETYLENPRKEDSIDEITGILTRIREELDDKFKDYLAENELPEKIQEETLPFYWPLQFWYAFREGDEGFDMVIGNPPYVRIQNLKKSVPHYVDYLNEIFETPHKNYDLAVLFTEKGYNLIKKEGVFGYIETKKWMHSDYGEKLRDFLSKEEALFEIVDFGDQQVFEQASTYTTLLFLQKAESESFKYSFIKNLTHNLNQLRKTGEHESLAEPDLSVDMKTYDGISSDPWVFTLPEERKIMDKLQSLPTLEDKSKIIFVGLQTSADPIYILEVLEDRGDMLRVYSKELDKNVEVEKEITRPILKGNEIDRWTIRKYDYVVIFPYKTNLQKEEYTLIGKEEMKEKYPKTLEYLEKNKERLLNRADVAKDVWWHYPYTKNLDKFEASKLITQVLASKSSFAFDYDGIYSFVGGGNAGGYGIVLEDKTNISYPYLLGLLNSSLLDWRLKKESSQFRGGYYSYAKRYIEKLPIKYSSEKEEGNTVNLTNEAIAFSKTKYKLEECWKNENPKFKNSERSLSKILDSDQSAIQEGNRKKVWTSDVSFYPSQKKDLLEKEFSDFDFEGDSESPTIKVYGVDGQEEEKIYEMEFVDRDLMQIVYLSLKELFDSRKKVETLDNILSKTIVPVIQPNIWENTQNILKEVKTRVEEWQEEKNQEEGVEPDIAKIENRIQKIENEIDTHVFDLYGLDREEVVTVLDSLETRESIKNDILEKFKNIGE